MQPKQALKRTLLAGVTILSLSLPSMVMAGPNTLTRGPHGAAYIPTMDADFPKMMAKYKMTVTPFNLVFLAFQGFLTSENIPPAFGLVQAYRAGEVSAEDLTRAAIKMNRLPAETLQDATYLRDVKSQLEILLQQSDG